MPVGGGAVERVIGGHGEGGLCYVDVRMGELCIQRCLLRCIDACNRDLRCGLGEVVGALSPRRKHPDVELGLSLFDGAD